MNLKQIEEKLNENLDILVDMACYSGDIGEITKAENNIKSIIPAITQLLAELKIEKESDDNDIKRGDGELTNYIRGSWMGFNTCADEINSKINKILNK